ncbi:hypothetical protein PGB90_000508 [Kerria lacca]
MTENSSISHNHQLYNMIRINNSDNTLHTWMSQIVTYLTANNEVPVYETQQPHLSQNIVCDGSCDCQTNVWVRELSYDEHYRKLLKSRVNMGDTNLMNSIDEESLRREASLVMDSVNQPTNMDEDPVQMDGEHLLPMDIEEISSNSGHSSNWDFVMYDSEDNESEDSVSDPTYKPSNSELLKLDNEYSSDEFESEDDDEAKDDDTLSTYTYGIRIPVSFKATSSNHARTVNIVRTYKNIQRRVDTYVEDADTNVDICEHVNDDSDDEDGYEYNRHEWNRPSTN